MTVAARRGASMTLTETLGEAERGVYDRSKQFDADSSQRGLARLCAFSRCRAAVHPVYDAVIAISKTPCKTIPASQT
ncbi:protein of unknown function [Pararobbsia alpina]